jgi:MFS family permease
METAYASKSSLLGALAGWVVWLIAVAFVVYYFSFQTGYSIVNPIVQKDIGLSVSQVGIVAATYTWVFAICQFFSGPLLDRLGSRKILVPSILLVALGIFIFADATSFSTLLLSQLVIAVGACSGFVGAGYVGGKWFGMAKFSFMFGLVQFSASLFSAFNQNILSWALSIYPWRELFNYVGWMGVVLCALAAFKLYDPVPVTVPKESNFRSFVSEIFLSLYNVARIPHIWSAAIFGALSFGVMLALGIVWAPKLLMARGLDLSSANFASSFLWLGLAVGCFITPWISDRLQRRKLPIIAGLALQFIALALLFYSAGQGMSLNLLLCFLFGFGNSAHMLAFSTAADVVKPELIGTSAAIVNGIMFIVGGIMISRPGVRIGLGLDVGTAPGSLELAQFAGRPLLLGIIIALIVACLIRETYPVKR